MRSFFYKIFGVKVDREHVMNCPACRRRYSEIQYQLKHGTGTLNLGDFSHENKNEGFVPRENVIDQNSKPIGINGSYHEYDQLKHTCGKK